MGDRIFLVNYIGLFFLGAATYFIFFTFLYLNIFVRFYKKKGTYSSGKIKAFLNKTIVTRTNNVRHKRSMLLPVIEYVFNGEKKLFLGSDQNTVKYNIGQIIPIIVIPDDKNGHYVLQKKNINVFFRNLMVPFLLFPLFGIYKNEAELGHKIFIPLLSGIVFIPIYLKMKKSFFLHKKKTNDHRSFYDFLLQDSLLEDNSISYEDFAINDKYLKSNERVAKSYRVTNTIGTLLLLGFTVLMYFVLNTMYNGSRKLMVEEVLKRFPENRLEQLVLAFCKSYRRFFI